MKYNIFVIAFLSLFVLFFPPVYAQYPGQGEPPPGGQPRNIGGAPGGPPQGMGRYGRAIQYDQNAAMIAGNVVLSPDEPGGEEIPGVGVTVIAVSLSGEKRDTVFTVVGERGRFMLPNIKPGKVSVTFSMLGYEELSKVVKLDPGMNRVVANLQPVKEQLDAAIIKETVAPLSIRNDTIVFHAAAVKTNKGEMAIDILEQMPGVEVTSNSVKVLDEEVSNVYVDGALLFGRAPMNALNNIAAEEVVNIKSYQEYANKDPYHVINKTENKQRVLDIETKSKITAVKNANVLLGSGFDTDTTYHKFRYAAGADYRYDSQKFTGYATFNVNNINDGANFRRGNTFRSAGGGGDADLRSISASASLSRKWWSKEAKNFMTGNLDLSYSFNNNYTVRESISEMIYFPTDNYSSRSSRSTNLSSNTASSHNLSIGGMKSLRDGNVSLKVSGSLSDSRNDSYNSTRNVQDDLTPQGTSNSTLARSSGSSLSGNFQFNKGIRNKLNLHMNADLSWSDTGGTTAKTDTTTSTINIKNIDISSDIGSRSLGLSPSVSYNIDDRQSVTFSYSFSDSYSISDRLAYDITDPSKCVVDSVNTQRLTNANNSHTARAAYSRYFEKLNANLVLSLSYVSTGLDRMDEFPETDIYGHRFDSFRPSVTFGRESILNRWSFSYSSSASTPSLEMVRPHLDNSNLYSVSVGNPDLKQSASRQLRLSYSTALGKDMRAALKAQEKGDYTKDLRNVSTIGIDGNVSLNKDVIVNRRTYFASDTYLPQYGYLMPAQSTLSTYENADNSYSAGLSARMDLQIEKIMWILSTSVSANWDDAPSFVNETLTRTENFRPSLNVRMRSNFSRNVRLYINGNGSYTYSHNDLKDATRYFTERLSAGADISNIFKHLYIGGNYNKQFTQGISYGNMNDNILNLNAGARFGPKNCLDLSVNVNDLFNKTTGFSTSMHSDYISNRWTHNFGRYVFFRLGYRFNNGKGSQFRF